MKSPVTANQIKQLKFLKDKKLCAYILENLIRTFSVIRHVDANLSEEEILLNIKSPAPVTCIKRLSKTVFEGGKNHMTPLNTYCITFNSQ